MRRPGAKKECRLDADELCLEFFARTAATYDASHSPRDEHGFALAWLVGLVEYHGFSSYLEVGAGTGRHLLELKARLPKLWLVAVEPVCVMREQAYAKGIPREIMIPGDGMALPFRDGSFDVVAEFGVLHHVPNPEVVINEMLRVSRKAIFISDCNNFGHGSRGVRYLKRMLRSLGLWRAFDWVRTGGKRYHVSDGDGISYSYSVFNDLRLVSRHTSAIHLLNTRSLDGPMTGNLLASASHIPESGGF